MTPFERAVVPVVVVGSALGGALSGNHPTANRVSDVVFTATFAGTVALAASIARTWTWITVAAAAAVCSTGAKQATGFVAELVAIGQGVWEPPARRVIGALVGAMSVQLLLRLGDGPFMASTALVAAAASVPVLVSAWRVARRETRVVVRRVVYVVGGAAGLVAVAAAFTLVQARSATNLAVARVRAGLDAARQGDTAAAGKELAAAAASFSAAQDDAGGWFARPATILPLIGQQVASIDLMTGAGEIAAAAAAKATAEADVNGLRMIGGRIDIERIKAAGPPLAEVLDALDRVQQAVNDATSPWLVPPLADRVDAVRSELARARDDAGLAAEVVAVAPGLLGDGAPRRYLVLFGNPAESRDLGGFVGGFGELIVDGGRLDLVRTGRISELNDGGPYPLPQPDALPLRYRGLELERFWQNVSGSPDFPTVSEAVRQLWPQTGGAALDGVLYVDPYALAAFLELTGPVEAPAFAQTLSADNIVRFLTVDQYSDPLVQDERHDLLSDTAKLVFDKVTSSDLPGPRQVADALGPPADAGRLFVHSFRDDEQALLARLSIDGALPAVAGDFLAVTASNRGANKIDSLVTRAISYEARVDPSTGMVDGTVRIAVRNDAPPSGRPPIVISGTAGQPDGTYSTVLTVLSPLGLQSATADGAPVPAAANAEYGRRSYSVALEVPPLSETVVELRLRGAVPLEDGYHLAVVPRANVSTDQLRVRISPADGWQLTDLSGLARSGDGAERSEDLSGFRAYGVRLRRP